MVKTIKYLS